MRERVRNKLKSLLFKKWFWVGVVLAFAMAFIFDLVIAFGVVVTKFYFGHWNPYLLAIGISSALFGAVGAKKKIWESQNLREIGKLLFFIAIIWVLKDYGFKSMLVFMFGILLTSRILKWFIPKKS